MRRLVSSAAALEADRRAETDFGYPPVLLMEEAGIRLQDELERRGFKSFVYLTGPGNNGGDAWVMARQAFLRGGRDVTVIRAAAPSSESCRQQEAWAHQAGVPVVDGTGDEAERVLKNAELWVDGLWGTGLRQPLRAESAALVARFEELRTRWSKSVAAIDVPSGLREGRAASEAVLRARWTLSPGPLKAFCFHPENRELVGEPVEVPVAFPVPAVAESFLYEESDLPSLVPAVSALAHKGGRGHVALVGAAPGMTGALVLAARSAAAAGAGLVSLGTDESLVPLIAPQVPAFQVRAAGIILEDDRYDAWVAGPGWGRTPDRAALLERLWKTDRPLVVDADALAAWLALGRPARGAPTVFTPHPGEFRRLGAEPTVPNAVALAEETGVTVVLKGAVTWIVAPGRQVAWDGLEPALGTGGSGDCLAGVTGAFLAAGQGAFEAACAAVALHGSAGRVLAREEGWFTADRLPEVLARTALACRTAASLL